MAWSTREIAELAGTSLRAVRHYHQVGLLPEPARSSNNYKQYGVAHLVRLVRIKRLTDLGLSLPQIAAIGDTDDHPEQALRDLDGELAATIERLQRARVELGIILESAAPTDLPPTFVTPDTAAQLSDADRSLVVVLSRVLGPRGLEVYADLLANTPVEPSVTVFDDLPADADEATRQDVAERLVPHIRAINAAHPGLAESRADAPGGGPLRRRDHRGSGGRAVQHGATRRPSPRERDRAGVSRLRRASATARDDGWVVRSRAGDGRSNPRFA